MDEKGFLIGILNKTRRVYSSTNEPKGAGQDGNRSWITVIAAICQDGTSLPPTIIYQGMSLQNSWLEDWQPEDQDAWFTATPTGWTNDEVGLSWLTKVFDRSTKRKARNGRDWRLLLIDGHGSHLNIPFIKYALARYPPQSINFLRKTRSSTQRSQAYVRPLASKRRKGSVQAQIERQELQKLRAEEKAKRSR
ncbi:hypothetical protein K402DRAFT_396103, partial [Aulographum hederae CBS 113979]